MKTLWLDTETYSAVPIRQGAHRYAEEAEVMLLSWAWNDDPVQVWDLQDLPHWRDALQDMVDEAHRVVAHNQGLDRTVLRHCGVTIPAEKVDDTMVDALRHSLPGKLETLCSVLGVPLDEAKDKAGKKLIQLFCKPLGKNRKLRRATRETHPDEWQRFIEYARSDVDAMRAVSRRTPRWNSSASERHLWLLDQATNDRGFAVDAPLAEAAQRAFRRASGTLAARAGDLSDGRVTTLTQRQRLLDYFAEEHGYELADMTKATVKDALTGDLEPAVRELLEIRTQAASTSPAKYGALLGAMSSDGRLRGTLQYCGASRSMRDAGRIFQPQNLPRVPDWFDREVQEHVAAAMKADCEDILYDNVPDLCAFSVRGCLVAPPGKKLVIADLSNIEGRVLAWLAGENWKLDAFKAYDTGTGHDLYKITAGRILGKDPGDITKTERQNQGKVPELSGGYQGGVGAYRKMGGPVFNAMSDDEILVIVRAWRGAHPRTKALWYDVEAAVRRAINNPDEAFEVRGLLTFGMKTDQTGTPWLRIHCPGGAYLSYRNPREDKAVCSTCHGNKVVVVGGTMEDLSPTRNVVCYECNGSGATGSGELSYEGMNQYTRKWERIKSYGGKYVENITQHVARQVFMHGFKLAMAAGYWVVLRVHDELVCEVPDDPAYSAEGLSAIMATNPGWAAGLPLAAAGHECYRYAKE